MIPPTGPPQPFNPDPNQPGQQPPPPATPGSTPVFPAAAGGPFTGQPGQTFSPDGRFWWNGYQWVPVTPPRNNAPIAIFIGCGAALLFVVFIIVVLTIVGKQVNNVTTTDLNNIIQNVINTPTP